MFQGTGSDVGKSLIVAGLGRVFTRRGMKVAPFKPQNMSNNAAVTADGGEIGRAQALQAIACGMPLSVHMNPVLLKPQSEIGSQIIVQGRIFGHAQARDYQDIKPKLMPFVLESFETLRAQYDLVLVEGAGSAAEINLRRNDIANMGFARTADVPVVIIGDIDRGGVIASIAGIKAVLDAGDVAMIEGFIVNKMRGDLSLFDDGMSFLSAHTGWRNLGLVPHFSPAGTLPAEDAMNVPKSRKTGVGRLKIAVLAYPRMSNFDEFDPLAAEPDVELRFIRMGETLPGDYDLVILPGSKATIADLDALRETGWDIDLKAHYRRGGRILGICGGYQMLGTSISDPDGMEGSPGMAPGLALLEVKTLLSGNKTLSHASGTTHLGGGFTGYEMHIGRSDTPSGARAYLRHDDGRPDGIITRDGRISGCYVHGLFAHTGFRRAFVESLGATSSAQDHNAAIDATLNALADHLERYLDCDEILSTAR